MHIRHHKSKRPRQNRTPLSGESDCPLSQPRSPLPSGKRINSSCPDPSISRLPDTILQSVFVEPPSAINIVFATIQSKLYLVISLFLLPEFGIDLQAGRDKQRHQATSHHPPEEILVAHLFLQPAGRHSRKHQPKAIKAVQIA